MFRFCICQYLPIWYNNKITSIKGLFQLWYLKIISRLKISSFLCVSSPFATGEPHESLNHHWENFCPIFLTFNIEIWHYCTEALPFFFLQLTFSVLLSKYFVLSVKTEVSKWVQMNRSFLRVNQQWFYYFEIQQDSSFYSWVDGVWRKIPGWEIVCWPFLVRISERLWPNSTNLPTHHRPHR